MDAVDVALKERICDATDRIPQSRWPLFSTTLDATIAVGGTTATLTFEAERDTLLTDLAIRSVNITGGAVAPGLLDIEYCNITYADHTEVAQYPYCCQRKPIFLVGVRENKRLKFVITLTAAAPAGGVHLEVTISGFQGNGCCS